jgi:hypothetical protein
VPVLTSRTGFLALAASTPTKQTMAQQLLLLLRHQKTFLCRKLEKLFLFPAQSLTQMPIKAQHALVTLVILAAERSLLPLIFHLLALKTFHSQQQEAA